jgi:hypothetical protein
MPRVSGRAVRAGARWALLAALLALAAGRIEWGEVGEALSGGSLELVVVAALANVASSVCKAMTWQARGGAAERGRSVAARRPGVPAAGGALVNSVGVARAGDVVKVAGGRRRHGPLVRGLPGGDRRPRAGAGRLPRGVRAGALAAGAARGGPRLGGGAPLAPRPRVPAGGDLRRPRHARPVAFAWLAIAALLAALGLGRVGLAGAGVLLAGVTLAHALRITPGGVGVNQLGAVLPLTATYGVAPEQALAFAVVLAPSETVPGIALGAACAVREGACANWPMHGRPIGTSEPAASLGCLRRPGSGNRRPIGRAPLGQLGLFGHSCGVA